MTRAHRVALISTVLLLCGGCDQATKHLARAELADGPRYSFLGDTFRLTYAENQGAMLSMGGDLPEPLRDFIFLGAVGVMLFAMLAYAVWSSRIGRQQAIAFGLITGGGLSNWLDRLLRDGSVVDFMNVGAGSVRTGIFNVADVAIFAGVGLLLFWRPPESASSLPPPPRSASSG